MKIKFLLTTFTLLSLTYINVIKSQNISILPGETSLIHTGVVYNSDFGPSNTGSGFSCNFNKGRGIISVGAEFQSDGYASWDEIRVAFYYNGSWKEVVQLWAKTPSTGVDYSDGLGSPTEAGPSSTKWLGQLTAGQYNTGYIFSNTNKVVKTCGHYAERHVDMYMRDMNNLNVYHNNYLPLGGKLNNRVTPADEYMYGIQTARYTASGEYYPCENDPNPATKKTTGYQVTNHKHFGNLPGVIFNQYSTEIAVIIINIANLPPDMLDAPNFKIHVYAKSIANNANRIYETTYSNQNFMTQGPIGLSASKNLCGKVTLNWSNSNNALPDDGNVTIKNVIFRNGAYLATTAGTLTTYDDATAAQDVSYQYTVRHVAFSETGETYYRSPATTATEGYVKPSPDEPITPTASNDKCDNKIILNWGFNGVNPSRFRIDYSTTSSTGPFTTITNTITGGTRSFTHSGLTRGQTYYYRMYSINSCSVLSTNYAECNGISPADPVMATSVTAVSNTVTNTVNLTWLDNANNETKYQIVRTDDQGNTILTDVNPNQTTYNDASAAACRLYTYKIRVFNDCVLSGIVSISQATVTLPPPNLQNTFDATHKLTASKGYFGNRVELSWGNNNGVNIDIFKVYRKQLGTALDSVQIASLGTGSALYIDNTADARVFYKYTIVGVKQCNGSELLTNISSDIGFRNPTGLVSGHIEYNGGVAVGGAKVLVNSTTGNTGTSLNFSPTGTLSIADSPQLEPGAQMRCEFWFKPNSVTGLVLSKNNAFSFGKNGANYEAKIFISSTAKTITIPVSQTYTVVVSGTVTATKTYTLSNNQWNQVSMNYDGTVLKAYVNGVLAGTVAASGNIDDNGNNLVFGNATDNFKIDEFRLVGQAVTDSVVYVEQNRILNGDEPQFKCNLHFDEAYGKYAYDPSKVGNLFNGNHANFNANVAWDNDIPTSSQLGYFGVTNALGNYNVSGIRYSGNGENFNLVPNYQTHSFTPNTRAVYIGDASYVYNNQDFIDNSSFPFTGTIFYKAGSNSCPVPGAGLLIDGTQVIVNGQPAVSGATGQFSISVPIGNHYVTIEKYGHDMKDGRYPPISGTHNFQAPLSGIQFLDSTLIKLVGRVVGGKLQADKAPGLGRSKNNIGQAKIILATPLTGTPCFTTAVVTNSATGEYEFDIPPLAYRIVDAYVITNSVVIGKSNLSNTSQIIDLTNAFFKNSVVDTLLDNNGGIVSIDSTRYQKRHDLIYRNTPIINVTMANGDVLIGDDTVKVGLTKISVKPIATNTLTLGNYGWGPFNFPVFSQGKVYSSVIHANEIYLNTDNNKKDTVPLSGKVIITNEMVDGTDPNGVFNFNNGKATYSFACGSPNLANNSLFPDLSYTKDFQLVVVPDGASSVSWLPNSTNTPSNKNYHGLVLGQKITGTGIATQGPERVDFILRDPPGSGSSATWGTGTTMSTSEEFSSSSQFEFGVDMKILTGAKALTGIGFAVETSVENNVTLGLHASITNGKSNGFTETITTNNSVSTRDDADNVGAPADIFIGRSRNWFVGPTGNVELLAAGQTTNCFGPVVNGKQLARTFGFAIAPGETKTRFSYTQKEIEEVVIPTLQAIRNNVLAMSSAYTCTLSTSHPLYGSNNDNPMWASFSAVPSTTTPLVYDKKDTIGASYIFRGYASFIKGNPTAVNDTVRIMNNQIALWKEALAQNEKEKWQCVNNMAGTLVDNFTLGSAIVNNSYSTDQETTESHTWEQSINPSIAFQIGGQVGGNGVEVSPSLSWTGTKGGVSNTSNATNTSFEYTLTDGDAGDVMSIDVYKLGSGNVFVTRGGQTMCPYEDALVCHYFNPSAPNDLINSHSYNATGYYTLANATVQREIPNIAITPAVQFNIPSNQSAVYQLNLSNQSPLSVNNDVDLQVRIASVSNPYGAVLKIDGQNANTIINIPSGGSVIKTLTIDRGPIEINYDSLMVIFSSACSEDIADTSYVTVHFIPTCTDITINTPVDNFVINNYNNSFQNIIIDNYNYNFGVAQNSSTVTGVAHPNFGLEKIGFEFKPANSSQWLQIQDFYKVTSAAQAAGTNTIYSVPQGQVYTQYGWTVTPQSYADGNYEIRTVSYCYNKDGSYATVYSPVHAGVMDRVNPHPFGTPTPGDGILDPNDDISIQFNEPIDISSLSYAPITSSLTGNFDIRGVLNGGDLRHSESLNFDGTADYAEVTGGASLQKRPFTIEFWAKLNTTGIDQTVISQGTDAIQNMSIGFDNTNKLKFTLANQTVLSTLPVVLPTDWHHYAVVYDYANTDAFIYIDGASKGTNSNFNAEYTGTGKLAFGKGLPANNNFFAGNMHEVRLFNKVRILGEITSTMNKTLSRNQAGLVYNWKMDEADGVVANDDIRNRSANIIGATWEVNPNGSAANFDGVDDNIEITSGIISINKEMDFTIEFWFNSTQSNISTLFSNGKGDGLYGDSLISWNIEKDAAGKIHVKHKGLDFVAVTNNYFDGKWHHFSLVMQRAGNLSAYIDGGLQNSVQALSFGELSGANLYMGARGWYNGFNNVFDNYYQGQLDEFRFWNTARKTEQVKRDKQFRLLGDEGGLQAFVPFEKYMVVLGTPSLSPTFNNQSKNTLTVNPQNGVSLVNTTPTIKLPRPVQFVNYTWSLNNDKIILSTTTAPELIENVTLDITVQNALDMRGNKMQSPKTWIAYINKNQVKWQDQEFNFEKTVDSVITFVAPIVNTGGALKAFTIGGLPSWMTANMTSGTIAPNSVKNITFTIPAGGSIGEFNTNLTVTTDFNFDEVLPITLKVKGTSPSWTVNPSAYQYQMNVFAQFKIDNVISTTVDSKIVALTPNGSVCGVANLQYVPAYDRYEAFLNIYSNTNTGDSIKFNIYDAPSGLTFVNVSPNLMFVENDVVGTVTNPVTFIANTEIKRNIPLNVGWTWISLPLKTNSLANSTLLMNAVNANTGDVVRSNSMFDQYDSGLGWLGGISQGAGFFNNQTYKVKVSQKDTIVHIGSILNPDSSQAKINVVNGWNWIGYVATKNTLVNEAMGNYNATTGDLLKSQYEFAYFDNAIGWTGSLTHMKPTMGYMLKSATNSNFNYPLSVSIAKVSQNQEAVTAVPQSIFPFTPEMYDNTMSAIVTGNICNEALEQENVALGAFDNTNSLRGYAYPMMTSDNKYNYYLTSYSNNDGEVLNLKYFNTTNGSIMQTANTVTFVTNSIAGTPFNPVKAYVPDSLKCNVVLNTTSVNELDNSINLSVYPNPFSENLTLRFNKAVSCDVELVDMLGKVVYSSSFKNKKEYNLMLDATANNSANKIAAGMYYIRLTGEVSKQIKVVKTK